MKFRGYLAITVVCLAILVCDLIQRFVIVPLGWLFPSRRDRILIAWAHFVGRLVTAPLSSIGGASIPEPPKVTSGPGVLILMNHQSLIDIPLMVNCVVGGFPRIVTRKRYARGIPLISHVLKLYQFPLVDPAAQASQTRRMLRELQEAARTSQVPMVIFPEGTRTKDGEIADFMTTGLRMILRSRSWKVFVFVVDGYAGFPKLRDFFAGMATIEGRVDLVAELEWSDPKGDHAAFSVEVRQLMVDHLAEVRGAPAA
ncbi:MAG TPA: 1-acyl-sn-glycerol-3-phosphate acyltransferase [Gemmatimonadetes bacterium]|nr:1-acyl-sn-glycerol-3-phosphate acyltransferase [Gemmatimonadota bacterium]